MSLNECASLTIHRIMHILSSQFMDNSSCHSKADLWDKDTFPGSSHRQSLQASITLCKKCRSWSKSALRLEHAHAALFQAFVNFQKCVSNLSPTKLHHCLPSHCHISPLCSLALSCMLWATFTSASVVWLSPSQTRTENQLRIVTGNFYHLLFKKCLNTH